jgi:hypothetical protein
MAFAEGGPLDLPEEGPITAVEYVRRKLVRQREDPVDPDRELLVNFARWEHHGPIVARLYVDFLAALERADVAVSNGQTELAARELGYAACAHKWLAWLTRYADKGEGK